MSLVRNEQRKLLATALNNLGVAAIVTGGFAPLVGFLIGTLQEDDPLRIASIVVIWLILGYALIRSAQRVLQELV